MLCYYGYNIKNRNQIIEILLKAKANPSIANKTKRTALHPLCDFPGVQNFNAIQLFIHYASQYLPQLLDMEDNSGETPLTLAQGWAKNHRLAAHDIKSAVEIIKLLKPYENAEQNIEVIELNNPNNNGACFCSIL